jgi:hypothetical protein
VVAFHFQFANQAGWKCDACRRNGLDVKRRCGWLGVKPEGVVWARKDVVIGSCPKSYVTAQSEGLVEEFFVRRRLGGLGIEGLSARQAEAFVVLEQALAGERPER